MTTIGRIISAIAVFGLLGSAAANAAPDLTGKSGNVAQSSGETRMVIKQVSPGVAEVTLENISGIVLNRDVKGESFVEEDKSGKGTSHVLPPSRLEGAIVSLTGVGPAWAGRSNETFNTAKMYNAVIKGGSASFRLVIPRSSFGTVFAVVPVITDTQQHLIAWGSHPVGQTKRFLVRSDGTKDMLTVLTVTADGSIRPASDTEVAKYEEVYRSYF